jgi:stress response protein YsnF
MPSDTTLAPPRTGFLFLDMMLATQRALLDQTFRGRGDARSTALTARGGARGEAARGEAVIPLGEEVLSVEARKVNGATTRVRRYVVETPVERQVALHDERVVVERRRPAVVVGADETADTLTEKMVEATETSEVPVVWKGVRLKEEVVLRLERSERTETVRETLRRDEVEVEQPRRAATATGGIERHGDGNNDNGKAAARRGEPKAG